MTAYYNEIDPFAAQWLRNLIAAGHIAPGDVDERDIRDVRPDELAGYTQCHFFAGVGVWSYALRKAGWPDDRPVWTGSCPCQPFSAAGRGKGVADERHLWPHWFHLIQNSKPEFVPVFGEQVASNDGLGWLDLVQADLEGAGYAWGGADICAAGIGAPHIRQRLWFVAERMGNSDSTGLEGFPGNGNSKTGRSESTGSASEASSDGGVADPETGGRLEECSDAGGCGSGNSAEERPAGHDTGGAACGLADTHGNRCSQGGEAAEAAGYRGAAGAACCDAGYELPGPTNGFWRDADWLFCRDGKWRPVEPGTFPLVDGAANRVGRLRAYGNAINAEAAVAFISAYKEVAA